MVMGRLAWRYPSVEGMEVCGKPLAGFPVWLWDLVVSMYIECHGGPEKRWIP